MLRQPLAHRVQTLAERTKLMLQPRATRTERQMRENDFAKRRASVIGTDFPIHEVVEVQPGDEAVSGQGE